MLGLTAGLATATTLDLDPTKSLAVSSELKATDNKVISVIRIPTLMTADGKQAKGNQTLKFDLDANAQTGVNVMGHTVDAGGTVTFQVKANEQGGLDLPIFPLTPHILSSNLFTITIDEVKLLSCPNGWTLSGTTCYTYDYKPVYGWSCPAGYRAAGKPNYQTDEGDICYGSGRYGLDPAATCRSGFVAHKWTYGYCTDVDAYTTGLSGKADCLAAGGEFTNGTGNYMCTFKSPWSYRMDHKCFDQTDNGNCVDKSDSRYTEPDCPSGYSYDRGGQCETMITRPAG